MTPARALALRIPLGIWSWVRQVSGDAAYDNYLRSTRRVAGVARAGSCAIGTGCVTQATPSRPLTRAEFYLDALRRRYSTISGCC
jgi:hypothetical protein